MKALATLAIAMLIGATGCVGRPSVVHREDTAITENVRARLAADAQTKPFAITVATTAGVVRVAGSVAKSADRDSVERIPRETPGVRSVDNDVRYGVAPVPVEASSQQRTGPQERHLWEVDRAVPYRTRARLIPLCPRLARIDVTEPTVFVVDDNASVRKSVQALVAATGLAVETYASAAEFLAAYDARRAGCFFD